MNKSEKNYSNPEREDWIVNEPHEFYDGDKDFTTLKAWIKCREVKLFFYKRILPLLPKEEKFNLDIQIRKASASTTSNISEGYGRYNYQDGSPVLQDFERLSV